MNFTRMKRRVNIANARILQILKCKRIVLKGIAKNDTIIFSILANGLPGKKGAPAVQNPRAADRMVGGVGVFGSALWGNRTLN